MVDRAYTPVSNVDAQWPDAKPDYLFDKFDFLIKIYGDGKLTPTFRNVSAGELI